MKIFISFIRDLLFIITSSLLIICSNLLFINLFKWSSSFKTFGFVLFSILTGGALWLIVPGFAYFLADKIFHISLNKKFSYWCFVLLAVLISVFLIFNIWNEILVYSRKKIFISSFKTFLILFLMLIFLSGASDTYKKRIQKDT